MKSEKTVTGAIAPKIIFEQSERYGLFTSHFSLLTINQNEQFSKKIRSIDIRKKTVII